MAARPLLSLTLSAIGVLAQQAYGNPSDLGRSGGPANSSLSTSTDLPLLSVPSSQIPSYGTPTPLSEDLPVYEYHGCAIVDLNGFSDPVPVAEGLLTHEACQDACEGTRIVAIFADSCRCGGDAEAFEPTDAAVCDNPCLGDPSLGMCGSLCPINGSKISTIYIAVIAPPEDPVNEKQIVPSLGPSANLDPPALPTSSEVVPPVPSVSVPVDTPKPSQKTNPPPVPAPENLEGPPASSVPALEPDVAPSDPVEPVPSESQPHTPSLVPTSEASSEGFNPWLVAGALQLVLLVIA